MEERTDIRETISRFDGVWRRVSGESTEPERHESERGGLCGFIEDELCAAAHDTRLARCLQGQDRSALMNLANRARRRARRMQAEYFIMHGKDHTPRPDCCPENGTLDALRMAYQRDIAAAQAYEKAASCEDSGELRALYESFAEDRRDSARCLRSMIVRRYQ